jgi:hypothetical protein
MAMTAEGKNRIMIYGPKRDGTYVVEFKTAAGEALANLNSQDRDSGYPAFSRTDAVWAIRA